MLGSAVLRLLISAALVAASPALVSCASQPQTNCAPGLFEYKGGCLTAASQNFATCTETRGQNLSVDERQTLGASVDAGIKGGGTGVVELTKTVVETELPDVTLRIVELCLELSKGMATGAEASGIDEQLNTLQDMLDATSKGEVSLRPERGPYDQEIRVSGKNWPANVEVEVNALPSLAVKRATTDSDGSFQVRITLDPTFEPVAPREITIQVRVVKASVPRPATALYEIAE